MCDDSRYGVDLDCSGWGEEDCVGFNALPGPPAVASLSFPHSTFSSVTVVWQPKPFPAKVMMSLDGVHWHPAQEGLLYANQDSLTLSNLEARHNHFMKIQFVASNDCNHFGIRDLGRAVSYTITPTQPRMVWDTCNALEVDPIMYFGWKCAGSFEDFDGHESLCLEVGLGRC